MVRILAGPEGRGLSVLSGGADGAFGQCLWRHAASARRFSLEQ